MQKTNVMRILDKNKIAYEFFEYDQNITNGEQVAEILGEDKKTVFKTLVTVSNIGENLVFIVPVAENLDLKKCAKCAGVKSVSMIKQKDLLGLTGYIHGGCSPVGMKKVFRTFIDTSASSLEKICFSGGHVGLQVKLSPSDLLKVIKFEYGELTLN